MIAFDYQRPRSLDEALHAATGDARFLAGGQSLIQAMKLRLSASERLVDLGALPGLDGVAVDGEALVIGAMARHAAVARHETVQRLLPALGELAGGIGDPMVREMGTIGGSLANADPAACYPTAVLALDAQIRTNRRVIAAADFFTGIYQTALEPDELIVSVRFERPRRAAYVKLPQPASRFALVGVFVADTAKGVRVAVTGARPVVYRETALEAALSRSFTPEAARAVTVTHEDLQADLHAPAAYRAAMIPVLAARAVAKSLSR